MQAIKLFDAAEILMLAAGVLFAHLCSDAGAPQQLTVVSPAKQRWWRQTMLANTKCRFGKLTHHRRARDRILFAT